MTTVKSFIQYIIEKQQRITHPVFKKTIRQTEIIFVIKNVQVLNNTLISNIPSRKTHYLIEDRQRVTHTSIRFHRNDIQRFGFCRNIFFCSNVRQMIHRIFDTDPVKIINLATGKDSRKNLMLLRRSQNKDSVTGRFLQCFQECVESGRGYNFGAQKIDRVKQTLKLGIISGVVITSSGFLICEFFPHAVSAVFTDSDELIGLAVDGLRLTVLMFPFVGAQIVIGNFFQSIGKVKISIFLSLTRQLLYLLPCLLLFPHWWGLKGIWISLPVSDSLAFITAVISLMIYIKKVSKEHPIADKVAE